MTFVFYNSSSLVLSISSKCYMASSYFICKRFSSLMWFRICSSYFCICYSNFLYSFLFRNDQIHFLCNSLCDCSYLLHLRFDEKFRITNFIDLRIKLENSFLQLINHNFKSSLIMPQMLLMRSPVILANPLNLPTL